MEKSQSTGMMWMWFWILGGALYWVGTTKGWWWGVAAAIVAVIIKMALAWGLVLLYPGDYTGKAFNVMKWFPAPLAAYISWWIFGGEFIGAV